MLTPEQHKLITDKIVEVVGEHSLNYVVVVEIPDAKDDGQLYTSVIWHGGVNTALGLIERAKMRMLEICRLHDFGQPQPGPFSPTDEH